MNKRDSIKSGRREFLRIAAAVAACALTAPSYRVLAAAVGDGPLKIGVIGSGRIGGTLGEIWLKSGHEVMFSSLNLENDRSLAARLGGKARAGTPKEAAAFGDVILVAVPYAALPEVGRDLGGLIRGKVVIDASNPIVARDGDMATAAREKGAGVASAEFLPGTRIVRAFNAIGYARLPTFAQRAGERIAMPIAGDDANAIAVASRLVREVGLEPVLIGPLEKGKYLIPGTPLAGEHTPEKIRQIAATLN